jgi:hypothetical protein
MSRARDLFDRIVAGGAAAIDQLMQDFQSESLWLDFKQVATQSTSPKLADDDRKNLAKAISGFGNSDGGVIVWGVKCKNIPKIGDVPTALVRFDNPQRFVSWLENAVSSCTIPAHQFVEHRPIPETPGAGQGFAVTLIPASNVAPLQCVQPGGTFQYYIRAGSNFIPAPHAVLAGMFGRRPLPSVQLAYSAPTFDVAGEEEFRLLASAYISLRNVGPTLVQRPYINIWTTAPGPQSRITLSGFNDSWHKYQPAGVTHLLAVDTLRIAPDADTSVCMIELDLAPPWQEAYRFRCSYGAEGTPLSEVSVTLTPQELKAFDERMIDIARRLMCRLPPDEAIATLFGRP